MGEEELASRIMSGLLWRTISYMDYHENYYHAFMAGLFAGTGYETILCYGISFFQKTALVKKSS